MKKILLSLFVFSPQLTLPAPLPTKPKQNDVTIKAIAQTAGWGLAGCWLLYQGLSALRPSAFAKEEKEEFEPLIFPFDSPSAQPGYVHRRISTDYKKIPTQVTISLACLYCAAFCFKNSWQADKDLFFESKKKLVTLYNQWIY